MPLQHKVYEFNAAIVRVPSSSVINGLRADDRGNPTYDGVRAEHNAYVGALENAGVSVQVLGPLEEFPDSIFVEDPALVFTAGAILLRPGVSTREGETAAIAPILRERFDRILEIKRGYVDGGDVLTTPNAVMIGLSARTNREGAESLIECLAELGLQGTIVETPANVLHFKSDCSLVSDDTVISTSRLAVSGVFDGFKQIIVPDGEEAAANALRVNDVVLVGSDYPKTIELLETSGFNVVPLKTSEIAKIDAGLSCMSLRWHE
jgi:dimethylargininase